MWPCSEVTPTGPPSALPQTCLPAWLQASLILLLVRTLTAVMFKLSVHALISTPVKGPATETVMLKAVTSVVRPPVHPVNCLSCLDAWTRMLSNAALLHQKALVTILCISLLSQLITSTLTAPFLAALMLLLDAVVLAACEHNFLQTDVTQMHPSILRSNYPPSLMASQPHLHTPGDCCQVSAVACVLLFFFTGFVLSLWLPGLPLRPRIGFQSKQCELWKPDWKQVAVVQKAIQPLS